ncbi:FliH/SctL family protein [Halovulum sp. GXIMD14794]
MSRPVVLQIFSPDLDEEPLAPEPDDIGRQLAEAWERGHAAGIQAGTEAAAKVHAEAQDQLRAALVETIGDQRMAQVEVQARVLADIAPMIRNLVARLAPELARAGLADQVAAEVETALRTRPEPAPIIRCSVESVAQLELALRDFGAISIQADPRLTPLEAEVHWDDGFEAIDFGAAIARLDAALAELATGDTPQEEIRHAG